MYGRPDRDLLPSESARFDEVCRFGLDQGEPVARTLAHAFADDPVWKWVFNSADPLDLERALPLAVAFVEATTAADEIHGFRDHRAVALWRAPAPRVSGEQREAAESRSAASWAAVAALVGDHMANVSEFGTATRAARPNEPHWYLQLVGVDPMHQGRGLGARVLEPMLRRSDRSGLPLYLESSNPRNHSFYRRLGFVERAEIQAAGSPMMLGFHRAPA